MLKLCFIPSGKLERTPLLQVCGALYLAQVIWALLVFIILYSLSTENSNYLKLFISSSYIVFFYIFICVFAKRLKALDHNHLWLIPIGVVFCSAFFITAILSIEILPVKVSYFMEGNYFLALLRAFFRGLVAFLGCFIVSLAVAFLPEYRTPIALTNP